uniref:hypothetical protein n=1 Tax=Falsiroseomonas oryziterrae TaxID=2911368 RepID=UPI001F20B7A1
MSGSFFPPNPFLDAWMTAANTAAGAWRGALGGGWQRQQLAALEAWNRQVLGFWAGALGWPMAAALRGAAPAPGQQDATPAPYVPEL